MGKSSRNKGRGKSPGESSHQQNARQPNHSEITEMFTSYEQKKADMQGASRDKESDHASRTGERKREYQPNEYQKEQNRKKQLEITGEVQEEHNLPNTQNKSTKHTLNPEAVPFEASSGASTSQAETSTLTSKDVPPEWTLSAQRKQYPQDSKHPINRYEDNFNFNGNQQSYWGGRGRGRGRGRDQKQDVYTFGRNAGRGGAEASDPVSDRPQEEPEMETKVPEALRCVVCYEIYDNKTRKPRSLRCGHTVCSLCVPSLIKRTVVGCPVCREVSTASNVEELPVNFPVLQMLEQLSPIKSSKKSGKSKPQENPSSSGKKSPHGSRCLDQGVRPCFYCDVCCQWVCDKCASIDHQSKRSCQVIPLKDALQQMKQRHEGNADAAKSGLADALAEISSYQNTLKSYSLLMRATFECIEEEHDRTKKSIDEGHQKAKELAATVSRFPEAKCLPDSLIAFSDVKKQCAAIQKWNSDELTKTMFHKDFLQMARVLLNTTVQLYANQSTLAKPAPKILAKLDTNGGVKYARLSVDGGRVHIHAVEAITEVEGARALPLENVKSILDVSSTLTFLELSWGGNIRGKIYIRLLGNTIRGRQFLLLCLGEQGPSFKNSNFHRIWWKGLPGEHIWGGDYTQGDGSGGAGLIQNYGNIQPAIPAVPVNKGLVAGRYEKEKISSIYRIYTKDAKDAKEEAAFGRVEFGIQLIESAMKHNNVKDVTISDCGVVVDAC